LKAEKFHGMLFIGPPGSGKTHMLLSLYETITEVAKREVPNVSKCARGVL